METSSLVSSVISNIGFVKGLMIGSVRRNVCVRVASNKNYQKVIEMSESKETYILKRFRQLGIFLSLTECKELMKMRKPALESLFKKIEKVATTKVVTKHLDVTLDKPIADGFWRLWKTAFNKYGKIVGSETYMIEVKGNSLHAFRELATKIYNSLRGETK